MKDFIAENSTYVAVFAGFLLGIPAVRMSREKGVAIPLYLDALKCLAFSAFSVISVLLFASMEGLIGGKGFHIGAVSTYGAYFFAPLFLLQIFKKDRGLVFDDFAVYVPVSLLLQRIRCIVTGCCIGKTIGSSGMRWPVREAEILFYALMLICLILYRRKGYIASKSKHIKTKGVMFPFLMICYGCLRFLLEFLRDNGKASLFHMAHIWSVLAVLTGLSIYIEIKRRFAPSNSNKR
ncbi:MAG: prolipoprotein diacylglyceryl transferase [Firmicutes bacterium]|nr:prolipoprotein diacylglyceryl transferase [Bacillota bacterium]